MYGNSNLFTSSRFYRSSEHLVTAGPERQYQETSSFHQHQERHETSGVQSTPIGIPNHGDHIGAGGRLFRDQISTPGGVSLSASAPRANGFGPWAIDNFSGFWPDLNANMFPSSGVTFSSPPLAGQQCLRDLHRSMGESSLFMAPPSSSVFASQPNINDLLNDMLSAHQLHSSNFGFPNLSSMFPVNFPPPPDVTGLFNSGGADVFGATSIAIGRRQNTTTTTPSPGADTINPTTPSQTHRTVINIPIRHQRQDVSKNGPAAFPVEPDVPQKGRPQGKGDYDFLDCHHRRCQSPGGNSSSRRENDNQRLKRCTTDQNHNPCSRIDGIPPSPHSRPKSSTPNVFFMERRSSATPTLTSPATPPVTPPTQSGRESRQRETSMSLSSSSPSDSPQTPLRLRRWPSDSGLLSRQPPPHSSRYQRNQQQQQQQQHNHYQPPLPPQHQRYHRPPSPPSGSASNTLSSTASSSASSTLPSSSTSSDPEARTHTACFPSEGVSSGTEDSAAADFADVSYWLARMQR
ncbi:hypothetical protein EGW08_004607 [Elysia chlorotica]|uniref:Uncharacterized protein n=1 Tax=Elysia chlorotica TaxID=188477 RepID=A0A433U1D8_ELYCH|nr:hypothetical protein EGW08_004607 [Elysia chlorotica]